MYRHGPPGDVPGVDHDLRRARAGTAAAFAVVGVVAATYAARIPAVQDRLGLTAGDLALAVLAVEGGALAGLPLGGALVGRRGSRRSLRAAFAVFVPGVVLVAAAPSLGALAAALALWAAANSVADVALNAQGTELDRRYGRPVLSGLHAAQGAGLLAGAAAATALAAAGVQLLAHVAAVAAVCAAVAAPATAPLVREPPAPPRARTPLPPPRPLLLLGAVAFCAFLVDGAATNWVAVHLRGRGASEATAAAGYLLLATGLVLGRLAGDRLTARWSRSRLVRACGVLATAGTAVVVLAPDVATALAGWALVGLAVAPLAPAVLGAAPGVAGVPAPAAIAVVTTIGYLGSFAGPPVVGVLAGRVTLPAALGVVALAGVATAALAGPALRRAR
jgi:MFS family permease